MNDMGSKVSADSAQKGIALVIVLLMISALVAITLELNISSRSEIYESANLRDCINALYVAKSGFYQGENVLAQETNNYDALTEKWANSDLISAQSATLFDDGYFRVSIEDESGKIPVNGLITGNDFNPAIKDVMTNFLSLPQFKLEPQMVTNIVNAIKDYLDADSDLTGGTQGAKEPPGYKNAPLERLDELLQITAISRDLFYGTSGVPGIARYLTVYGNGKININTAPRPVLMALSKNMTDDLAGQMESYRTAAGNDLSDPTWYQRISGMSGININSGLISVRSKVFRIKSTGYLRGMSETATGVIERGDNPKQIKIKEWKIES